MKKFFAEILNFFKRILGFLFGKQEEKEIPVDPKPQPKPETKPELGPAPEKEVSTPEEKEKFDSQDLASLMSAWGTDNEKYDLNDDGTVDGSDLGILLLNMKTKQEEETPKKGDLLLYPHHGTLSSRYFRSKGIGDPNRYELLHQIANEEEMDKVARTRAGAELYYIWYASWDSGHGSKTGSLSINTDKVIADVRAFYGDEEPTGYGQLDYEGDFFRGLDKGKGTPENAEATRVMVEALRVMKQEFPKMKWTYYGLPLLKYWLPHPSPTTAYQWANAPEEVKQNEIDFKYGCYEELMSECDWLNPSFYNRYDPDSFNHDIIGRESAYRKELVRFCHMFNERMGTTKPIIPMIGPWYAPGGRYEWKNKTVQNDFIRKATLLPYLEEGIDGLATWYAHTFYVGIAIPGQGKTPSAEWKNAFIRNYNLNENEIPWEYGSGTEEERYEWRSKLTELSSQTILQHLKVARSTMDEFYSK